MEVRGGGRRRLSRSGGNEWNWRGMGGRNGKRCGGGGGKALELSKLSKLRERQRQRGSRVWRGTTEKGVARDADTHSFLLIVFVVGCEAKARSKRTKKKNTAKSYFTSINSRKRVRRPRAQWGAAQHERAKDASEKKKKKKKRARRVDASGWGHAADMMEARLDWRKERQEKMQVQAKQCLSSAMLWRITKVAYGGLIWKERAGSGGKGGR